MRDVAEAQARNQAVRLYFIANDWPVNIDGTLKVIGKLDHDELVKIARRHACILQDEFRSIHTRGKR